jgi:hypothetical protein
MIEQLGVIEDVAAAIEEALDAEWGWCGGLYIQRDGVAMLGIDGDINLTQLVRRLELIFQEPRFIPHSQPGGASGPGSAKAPGA